MPHFNLPSYKFLYVVKGGGSANKTQLFQKTKALLNESSFEKFIVEELLRIGTAACPPYHLAVCVGGLSSDQTLKTVIKIFQNSFFRIEYKSILIFLHLMLRGPTKTYSLWTIDIDMSIATVVALRK